MLGLVPEKKPMRGASRYETYIATFVGLCALCLGGYTAYMQSQQVRAMVWPILEFGSNNGPIKLTLANKGVGPAMIKNVVVRVDGQPVKNWVEVMSKLTGPGEEPHFEESDMNGRVLAAGESMAIFIPHDANNNPLNFDKSNPLWVALNKDRFRVSVEVCYSSTLGECWTLRADGSKPSTTTETRKCPSPSAITFEQ